MHRIDDAIVTDGKLVLSDLPFADGQRVRIVIVEVDENVPKTASIHEVRRLLKGGVEQFDDPFEPMNQDPRQRRHRTEQIVAAPFTPRQGEFLAFIYQYTNANGRPPAEGDMQRHFRTSPPSIHQMVVMLEKRGFIERTPGKARSIRLLLPLEQLSGHVMGRPRI